MMISFLGLIKVVSEFSFGYYRVVFSTASSALVGGVVSGPPPFGLPQIGLPQIGLPPFGLTPIGLPLIGLPPFGLFLKQGVKINMRNANPKQHNSNWFTGTRRSGTKVLASSPLYLIPCH